MIEQTHKQRICTAATEFIARGWRWIPIRTYDDAEPKRPRDKAWEKKDYSGDPSGHFDAKSNIGIQWGDTAGGDVDLDFDKPEVIPFADIVFANAPAYGRDAKPRSHRLVNCPGVKTFKFVLPPSFKELEPCKGDHGVDILEIRSSGAQSVVPPSRYGDGPIRWDTELPPGGLPTWEPDELRCAMACAALCAVFRMWYPPPGARHDPLLALCGALLNAGASVATASALVTEMAGTLGWPERVENTAKHKEGGEDFTGLPRLVELLGIPADFATQFNKWLGTKATARPAKPRDPDDKRPTIEWDESRYDKGMLQAQQVLLDCKVPVFQSGGTLTHTYRHNQEHVEVEPDGTIKFKRPAGALVQATVNEEALRLYLQENILFEEYSARSRRVVPIPAPHPLAKAYIENPRIWKLRVLNGVVEAPCLRADGSILQIGGYDPQSGLIADFNGVKFPPILENPSYFDAIEAMRTLVDLLKEFPFVDRASQSVALSGILTLFQRRAMRDCPFHGVDANSAGTGKSTLGHVTAIIGTGREAVTISLPSGRDDVEARKVWLSTLRENPLAIMIDNVMPGVPIASPSLCTILTQPQWKERILGESRDLEVSTQVLFMGNGNNLVFGSDMAVRAIRCRMNRNEARPDQHKFARDVLADAKERRPELAVACLTILRAYIAWVNAGRQEFEFRSTWDTGQMMAWDVCAPKYRTSTRFRDWDKMIREPLLWLGLADP